MTVQAGQLDTVTRAPATDDTQPLRLQLTPPPVQPLARAGMAALFVVIVGILWYLYLQISRTLHVESDGASNALQAWDMLHGNALLHGWTVTDVSFYTTELPEYMIIEAWRGLNADVLHLAAALSYALLVPLAAVLAKGRASGRTALIRMLIAAGIMVAPQPGPGAFILLFQPDHIGTQVPILLTWLVLDRAPRRWCTPILVGIMLTWIGLADQVILLAGVAPLALVCGIRAFRRREAGYELSLSAAAIISVPVTAGATAVIHALGGYSVLPVGTGLARVGQLPAHLDLAGDGVLGLFGASFQNAPHGWALAFAIVHIAGIALVAWGLCIAVRHFAAIDDIIVQVLTASIIITMAAYVASGKPSTYWSVREIAGILPAGAVLAGRLLAPRIMAPRTAKPRLLAPGRQLAPRPLRPRWHAGGLLASGLAVVLAGYLGALGFAAAMPPASATGQDLVGWLKAHQLTYGISGYGLANAMTMASGNIVAVRPVVAEARRMAPGPHEYSLAWYDPRFHDARYLVLLTHPAPLDPMTSRQARAAFGPPAHQYRYRGFLIMTWRQNLLAKLAPAIRSL
jgi:hypothetical protein